MHYNTSHKNEKAVLIAPEGQEEAENCLLSLFPNATKRTVPLLHLCEAMDQLTSQQLDDYEAQESYRLEYVEPLLAMSKNYNVKNSPYNQMMFEREARVLENLIADGLLK